IITSFLNEIEPALEAFLRREEPFDFWDPKDDNLPYLDFLKSLKIPATLQNKPDMLLHDLGSFGGDEKLRNRVKRLFHTVAGRLISTLLLNTSGSGKTRMVLEGLCQMWGFYFTCSVDEPGHGSRDIHETLTKRIPNDACFTTHLPATDFDRIHKINREIALNRFGEALLARLCIFERFCEVAVKLFGENLTDKHRKFWVILQLNSECIDSPYPDIFDSLTDQLQGIETLYREDQTKQKVIDLRSGPVLSGHPIFCVLDEAQVADGCLTHAFMTTVKGKTTRRSGLRDLGTALAVAGVNVNFTGTGIRKDKIVEIMASPVLKRLDTETVTHFGAFNVAAEQIAYMKQFIPPALAEEDSFKELFARVSHWLRGRYRFTAAFTKELLMTGFQRPHLRLNAFIRHSTRVPLPLTVDLQWSRGFEPTDSQEYWEDGEVLPSELESFNFDKLKEKIIACGFARYAEDDIGNQKDAKVALDEPLALLALGEWLQIHNVPLVEQLRISARKAAMNAATGANGLEEYLAFYFSAVFDDETPLTEIFRFNPHLEPPHWAKKPATLVSLYRSDPDDGKVREGFVAHHSRPSVTIGNGASTIRQTMEWLDHKDKNRAPICFPDTLIGPDLIFVLKLGDDEESKIWVTVQSKFSGEDTLPAQRIVDAVPTTTPNQFYGLRVNATYLYSLAMVTCF
ncbi:hypothetical protein C8R43DRAFT_880435, partial [Mycena crocata]